MLPLGSKAAPGMGETGETWLLDAPKSDED